MDVIVDGPVDADQLDTYAVALSRLPHVVAVKLAPAIYVSGQRIGDEPAANANGAYLTVLPDVDPCSDAAHRLLDQVRGPHLQLPSLSVDSVQKTSIPNMLCCSEFRWP
jgi:RND superfamily putative drug exporter